MTESLPLSQLADQAESVRQLCAGVDDAQARWRPDADSWSLLEVINHLADEESEDFRTRLDCILHHAEDPWPPIDPAGWVLQRRYNQRDLGESLRRFSVAREESLEWLRSLGETDLNVSAPRALGRPDSRRRHARRLGGPRSPAFASTGRIALRMDGTAHGTLERRLRR